MVVGQEFGLPRCNQSTVCATTRGKSYIPQVVLPEYFLFPGNEVVDVLTPLGKDEAREMGAPTAVSRS